MFDKLRAANKIKELAFYIDNKFINKRCGYCNRDLGSGENVQVLEFIDHLKSNHHEILTIEDLNKLNKLRALIIENY